jgi:peptidylprolyl isomerase
VASGGAWAPPRLTYPTPLDATTRRTDVLWEGVGPTVKKGDVVVLDTYAEDGRSRKVVANSFAGAPRVARAEPKTLGSDLYRLVAGRAAGTRLLDVQKSGGVPLATTIDVLAGRAVGAPLPQGKGEPVVTRASDGEPHITVPKGAKAPTQLATLPLVHGTGPQVEAGQQVTVQFTGVTWADGKVFDTTWGSDRLPVTVTLGVGDVIEGWDEGLIELPVGSEVMLIVPPDLAYQGTDSKLADQTLVYVVDILDAHTPGTPPKPGSVVTPQPVPSTGGTATKSADPSS